ncbi:MAG TPA: hypothetical protein PK122_05860 [Candidatus Paceibacterota bacterium]|nr:hypothetical protein [Candidatus Paceibacterota bacterium]
MLNKNLKNLIMLGTVLFSILIAGKAMAATNNPYSYPYSYDSSYQYFQYPGYSPEPVKKEIKTEEGNTIINNYYYYTDGSNVPVRDVVNTNTNGYLTNNRNTTNNHLSEYPVYAYNQAQGVYPNYMAASAFGAYDNGNNYTRNNSYGFLPNTFGQWILTIILILGIIVVYRVIMRQFKKEKAA